MNADLISRDTVPDPSFNQRFVFVRLPKQHNNKINNNIQGQPVNIGVFVDQTYDIGRLEDIHFNPWFSKQHPFVYHQTNFGVAFIFARSDWEYAFNLFAFG